MKTPYSVLGVPRDADNKTIKAALRRAAKAHHPDLNTGDRASEQRLREVIAAYEMLKHPERRAAYDRHLELLRRRKILHLAAMVASAGVVGASILALTASPPSPKDASVATPAPRVAAVTVSKRASQDVAASDDSGLGPKQDGRHETDSGAAATNPRAQDDAPRHPHRPAGGMQAREEHPRPPARLADEWEQVQASRDPMAIWAFTARHPGTREAELARSTLTLLIDATEDVSALDVLRDLATGKVAAQARQRLIALGAVVKDDTSAVAGNDDATPDLAPSKDPASYLAFYLARGLFRYHRGDLDRAIADFDEVIRLEPGYASAYSHRGNAWGGKGDQDRALADYQLAIRIDPHDPIAFRDRGVLWRRSGALDRALVDLDQAIRLGFSDAGAYNERGLVWHEKGRHERAVADFNQAIRIDPRFASAYINRGIALRNKGDLDRAIADFDQAIRIDPNMPMGYYNRALARGQKHDPDGATADYAKARELMPGDAPDLISARMR